MQQKKLSGATFAGQPILLATAPPLVDRPTQLICILQRTNIKDICRIANSASDQNWLSCKFLLYLTNTICLLQNANRMSATLANLVATYK